MKATKIISGIGLLGSFFIGGIYIGSSNRDDFYSNLQANLYNTSSKLTDSKYKSPYANGRYRYSNTRYKNSQAKTQESTTKKAKFVPSPVIPQLRVEPTGRTDQNLGALPETYQKQVIQAPKVELVEQYVEPTYKMSAEKPQEHFSGAVPPQTRSKPIGREDNLGAIIPTTQAPPFVVNEPVIAPEVIVPEIVTPIITQEPPTTETINLPFFTPKVEESSPFLFQTSHETTLSAKIIDDYDEPLSGVKIEFINPKTKDILAQGITNKFGVLPHQLISLPNILTQIEVHAFKPGWIVPNTNKRHFYKTEALRFPYSINITLEEL